MILGRSKFLTCPLWKLFRNKSDRHLVDFFKVVQDPVADLLQDDLPDSVVDVGGEFQKANGKSME